MKNIGKESRVVDIYITAIATKYTAVPSNDIKDSMAANVLEPGAGIIHHILFVVDILKIINIIVKVLKMCKWQSPVLCYLKKIRILLLVSLKDNIAERKAIHYEHEIVWKCLSGFCYVIASHKDKYDIDYAVVQHRKPYI